MIYQVSLAPAAVRDLKRVKDRTALRHIRDAIDGLADDPYSTGATELTGKDDLWRVRSGDYRIVYKIEKDRLIVLVVRIGHRRSVYEKGK